ncbi:MAG: hypothetical protein KDD73_07555, partial [Anaerolineales bacterium]|nr:hypothetical protein [Anaerolineales bacterium]
KRVFTARFTFFVVRSFERWYGKMQKTHRENKVAPTLIKLTKLIKRQRMQGCLQSKSGLIWAR